MGPRCRSPLQSRRWELRMCPPNMAFGCLERPEEGAQPIPVWSGGSLQGAAMLSSAQRWHHSRPFPRQALDSAPLRGYLATERGGSPVCIWSVPALSVTTLSGSVSAAAASIAFVVLTLRTLRASWSVLATDGPSPAPWSSRRFSGSAPMRSAGRAPPGEVDVGGLRAS